MSTNIFIVRTSGELLTSSGWGPEMLLSPLQCRAWPPMMEKDLALNLSSAGLETLSPPLSHHNEELNALSPFFPFPGREKTMLLFPKE